MYINLIILSGLFEGVSLQHVGLYILKQYTHTILIYALSSRVLCVLCLSQRMRKLKERAFVSIHMNDGLFILPELYW